MCAMLSNLHAGIQKQASFYGKLPLIYSLSARGKPEKPGNWVQRNIPGMEPSTAESAKFYARRGLRRGMDTLSSGLNYIKPRSYSEMIALAGAGAGATGFLGNTVRSLSPLTGLAPLAEYIYTAKQKDFLRDPKFHRAALFAAAPAVGKIFGNYFGPARRPVKQQLYYA